MSRFLLIASLMVPGVISGCVDAGPGDGPDITAAPDVATPIVLNGTLGNSANTVRAWDPASNNVPGSFWAPDANHMGTIYTQGDAPDPTGSPKSFALYAWLVADTSPFGAAGTGPAYIYRIWRVLPEDKATFQSEIVVQQAATQASFGTDGSLVTTNGAPQGGVATGGPHIGHGGDGTVAYPSSLLSNAVSAVQSSMTVTRNFRANLNAYTFPQE